MWQVIRVTRDYEDRWEHVESEHESEAKADAERDRLERTSPWPEDSYIVREER